MRPNTSPRIGVVKREEKEARLKDFIRDRIQGLGQGDLGRALEPVLLIARSADSPVVRALETVLRDDGLAAIGVRAILAVLPERDCSDRGTSSSERLQLRWARDPRLIEAHEQLVLGSAASWTGDCMRRDPAKRDAYECYAEACVETARSARIGFEQLWLASEPVEPACGLMPSLPVVRPPAAEAVVPEAQAAPAAPSAATSH